MTIFLSIFGSIILIVGLVTSRIATKFNAFDTTPFSKYTFSKFCYEFEDVCNTLVVIGATMILISLLI